MTKKCVSCFSGGADSFAISVIMKHRGYKVYPIVFIYGQKGAKEVEVAENLAAKAGFERPVKLMIGGDVAHIWKGNQLIDEEVEVMDRFNPNSIVPVRNAIFLSFATSYALNIGAEAVCYGGVLNEFLYPDCRAKFAEIFEQLVDYGHSPVGVKKLRIISPATEGLARHELFKMAYEIVGDLIFETWSCLRSGEKQCGACLNCISRHDGFVKAGIEDRTDYLRKFGDG